VFITANWKIVEVTRAELVQGGTVWTYEIEIVVEKKEGK